MGFSLRGVEQAEANLRSDCGHGQRVFTSRRDATVAAWTDHLDRVTVEGGDDDATTTFATALYHSLVKPSFAADESPFWPGGGPWVFDISTMWDIYKTQLPLLTTIAPDRAVELVNALLKICEEEGNLPIGYRMARGADRFFRQASALAHTLVGDVAALGLEGIDWDWALVHLHADLRRAWGEEFVDHGVTHPVSHTLDLAQGYACTARVARLVGDDHLAKRFDELAAQWVNAFDPSTGLLVDSTFYEGGRWNYSFRLVHDMAARIDLAGGPARFVDLLDRFFGFDAPPVTQLGGPPFGDEVARGYALDRFEGLNNEPDMEAPWAYHWAGRPDRTAEVVHAVVTNQFGTGRGGLPGNDDSGGLSSWLVWASLGLFPVAGQHLFLVNAPTFPHARIDVGGHDLSIETTGWTRPEPGGPPNHVQSVTVDDTPLHATHLDSRALREVSTIRIDLGPRPSGWGGDHPPPSAGDPSLGIPRSNR
nr:glycoside hydrolase domain-containing protein [Salsipaludibacter albus]